MPRNSRALLLDLDDTLYPLLRFRLSGFAAVARHLARYHAVDEAQAFRLLSSAARGPQRGRELDLVIQRFKLDVPVAAEVRPVGQHHAEPVRSGQRLYARGTDLTVAAVVGHGAEVIADGSIHIYGVLRGRALAGARGDTAARIYCQNFQAELVAIAGQYRVFEEPVAEWHGKPVQAWLEGDKLRLAPLS